jgi:hypothetical protein
MHNSGISIWFFIGVLLTVYGAMILANLHAPVWWGAIMLALGIFYGVRFRPGHEE